MSEKEAEQKRKQTTVRLEQLTTVKMHMLNMGYKTLNTYVNELIRRDILRNADEYIIRKYFKENRDRGKEARENMGSGT
jgi:hypothetical protein